MNMKKTVMALVLSCQVMMACGQQKAKQTAPQGRVFKNRIKIWYKKWCYIGVSKLLIFNTLTYKIALCKFA